MPTGTYFNLSMLPVPGLSDLTIPAHQQLSNWQTQLAILRGIHGLEKGVGLGPYLKMHLDSLAFYCRLAIANLQTVMGRSSAWESSGTAEGIQEVTQAFLMELPKAQQAWNQWLGSKSAVKGATKLPAAPASKKVNLPAIGMYGGFGAAGDSTEQQSLMSSLSQQTPMSHSWVRLGIAAGLMFVAYVVSRR